MCDVVFITPNMDGDMHAEAFGTLQLTTILQQKGISCDILQFFRIGDLSEFESFLENAVKMIEERRPKIVSFYTRCDVYHIDLRLAERIKARFNDVYVVFGGPQSDITADATVSQIPYVDFVCCGEGENTVYPLFSSLLRGVPDLTVPGLVYRVGSEICKNPRPELIADLDELPMLDYSLLHYTNDDIAENKSFPINVGRGCPFGCTFCSTKSFWGRKFRLSSPQRIFLEIQDIHKRFGTTRFGFSHDMFTFNRNMVIETCNLLRTLDFAIEWACSARLDCIDRELIDIMADAGLVAIYIGIETGSPRMQKLINKKLNLENAVETVGYLNSKGIETTASFIYGFPDETEEDISKTMSLIAALLKFKGVTVQTHLCAFLAGTELSEKYRSELKPTEQYSDQTGEHAIEECKDLIQGNPELFTQMLEYKTELRTKLRYFKLFFYMWQSMQPVYQYISEKYPADSLIDMYYDFVNANLEILPKIEMLNNSEKCQRLIREDRFPLRFADDERYDIISDMYRLKITSMSDEVANGGSVTDVYCFSPADSNDCTSVSEIERCIAYVTCTKDKLSTIKV